MAAYNPRANRLTKYDILEATGYFAVNPANVGSMDKDGSPLYEGPVEYPKMLYHPQGERREVTPQRVEPSPIGPQTIPATYEIIFQVVKNEKEEEKLRDEGWWDHPADAIEAWNAANPSEKPQLVPPKSSDTRIKQLEAELARVQKLIPASSKGSKNAPNETTA